MLTWRDGLRAVRSKAIWAHAEPVTPLASPTIPLLAKPVAAGLLTKRNRARIVEHMKGKFTAIIEEAPEGGCWAICPEVPGANGQGETVAEAKKSLRDA